MKSLFSLTVALVLSSFLLSGCQNTVQGFGQDMQKNGQEIKNSVKS